MRARLLAISLLAALGVLAWGELLHWRASRRGLGTEGRAGGVEAVVVLGYGNRGDRANAVNRFRVRAGIRSRDPRARRSVLVLCGGAVEGPRPEAEVMADYARAGCGYSGPMLLERTSTTTWENVRNVLPLIETADAIKVVSDALHAEKARWYLWMLRPDLAARLVRGREYRFGERILSSPATAVVGLVGVRRARAGRASRTRFLRSPGRNLKIS